MQQGTVDRGYLHRIIARMKGCRGYDAGEVPRRDVPRREVLHRLWVTCLSRDIKPRQTVSAMFDFVEYLGWWFTQSEDYLRLDTTHITNRHVQGGYIVHEMMIAHARLARTHLVAPASPLMQTCRQLPDHWFMIPEWLTGIGDDWRHSWNKSVPPFVCFCVWNQTGQSLRTCWLPDVMSTKMYSR